MNTDGVHRDSDSLENAQAQESSEDEDFAIRELDLPEVREQANAMSCD